MIDQKGEKLMTKNCVSCGVRRIVLAAGFAAFGVSAAFAVEYVWDGGEGDGKWSSAANWNPDGVPGKDDDVVFNASSGSATVDEGFGGEVMRLTLAEGYAGTVTLGREFTVAHTLTIEGGTLTCGNFDLNLGGVKRTVNQAQYPGNIYQRGGTFNAPSGTLRVYSRNNNVHVYLIGGVFNANGGTVRIERYGNIEQNLWFASQDRTFHNLEIPDLNPGKNNGSDPRLMFYGTNTVTGAFTHKWGNFWSSEKDGFKFGKSNPALHLKGDLYVGGNAAGGGLKVILDGTGDQTVWGDSTGRAAMSLWVEKTSGTAYFKGDIVKLAPGAGGWQGVWFRTPSKIDMSELNTFDVQANSGEKTGLRIEDGVEFEPPENFICRPFEWGRFQVRDRTFKNLALLCVNYGTRYPQGCTNTVTGTFTQGGCLSNVKYSDYVNLGVAGAIICLGDIAITNKPGSGGYTPVYIAGAGDQTIHTCPGAVLGKFIMCKPEGSRVKMDNADGKLLLGADGQVDGNSFIFESGIFEFPRVELGITNTQNIVFKQTGGVLEETGAPVVICAGGVNGNIGPLTQPISKLHIASVNTSQAFTETITVTNEFKICGKSYIVGSGTLNCQGDFIIEGTALHSSGQQTPIKFTGGNDQVIRTEIPQWAPTWGAITVDKTGGKITLESDFAVTNDSTRNAGGYEQFYWKNGIIDLNGHDLYLGNRVDMESGAKAVIPQGSHLFGGKSTMTVLAGATFAFQPPADGDERPVVCCDRQLSLPRSNDAVNLELLGKVTPESVTHFPLFTYDSFAYAYDFTKTVWNVTLCEDASRPRGVPFVQHVADDKTIYFNWKYKTGMCLFVR